MSKHRPKAKPKTTLDGSDSESSLKTNQTPSQNKIDMSRHVKIHHTPHEKEEMKKTFNDSKKSLAVPPLSP